MITCLGLVVGVLDTVIRQDVLNKCATFLSTHRYLLGLDVQFKINNELYVTVIDICDEHDSLWVLFRTYDGRMVVGIAQLD